MPYYFLVLNVGCNDSFVRWAESDSALAQEIADEFCKKPADVELHEVPSEDLAWAQAQPDLYFYHRIAECT